MLYEEKWSLVRKDKGNEKGFNKVLIYEVVFGKYNNIFIVFIYLCNVNFYLRVKFGKKIYGL